MAKENRGERENDSEGGGGGDDKWCCLLWVERAIVANDIFIELMKKKMSEAKIN